ncbi:MAG: hypothetical protein EA379_02310 [Phycisphaerales bacterium]|nr:MAG: hypothetical protein EA379_02310 [Phycisphaerales bacterium]
MLRWVNLLALVALGTVWAGLLVVGGYALASYGWFASGASARAGLAGGLTAIAAGQFVFLVVVGDRLFPGASRVSVMVAELGFGSLFVIGAAMTAMSLVFGATS